MQQYKGCRIYGSAVPVSGWGSEWRAQGIIFDRQIKTHPVEMKRIEDPTSRTFATEAEAEQHGLELCRTWLDEKRGRLSEK